MLAKQTQEKNSENSTFSQKITDFLLKFRVAIIAICACVAVAIIGFLAVSIVVEKKNEKAFEAVELAFADWEKARGTGDTSALASKEDEIIASLTKVAAANGKSYATARAQNTIAEIYFSRKDWKNALDHYRLAAVAAPKAYTVGMNYFNAAVCSDELGNEDDAIADFNQAVSFENFNLKSRALFNIGRIEEQRSKTDAAIAAYEKLADQYPDDDWTLLAKSRIIALQIKK